MVQGTLEVLSMGLGKTFRKLAGVEENNGTGMGDVIDPELSADIKQVQETETDEGI